MRIAFLVGRYPVLSEVFIAYQAVSLVKSGCAVDLIPINGLVPSVERHPIQDDVEALLHIRAPRHVYDLRARFLAAPSVLSLMLREHGWAALRALDPRVFGLAALTLRPVMRAQAICGRDYDVIHCQFGDIAPFAFGLRSAGLTRARIVVHFRGYDITGHVARYGHGVYDRVFKEADRFIANCEYFRDKAVALGCPPDLIDVVPTGTDLERFPFRPRSFPADGAVRLLAVGRLVDKKGFSLAIDAVRRLRQRGREVSLRIAGEGPLRAELETQISSTGLAGVVTLLGSRTHADIVRELDAAHIFIAPSLRARTGDSDAAVNTIKEALTSGVPVVASDHGGIPELVRDGVDGLLCREGDSEALADRVADMIDAADEWSAFGHRGRARIEECASTDISTAQLLSIYARALDSSRGFK